MKYNAPRNLTIAIVFIAINVVLIGLFTRLRHSGTTPPNVSDFAVSREKQTARLAKWASEDVIPLSEREKWIKALEHSPLGGCLTPPEGAIALAEGSIDQRAIADLDHAVADLMTAYTTDQFDDLWDYMVTRSERPNQEQVSRVVNVVKEMLREKNLPINVNINSLNPKELYSLYKKESGIKTHWTSVLAQSFCRQLWTITRGPSTNQQNAIPIDESSIFQNVVKIFHLFTPETSLQAVADRDGKIMFADVKTVILLDAELYSEAVPYYIRFWYDPEKKLWHPYQLGRSVTGESASKTWHMF